MRVEHHAASVDHAGSPDADAEHRPVGALAQLLRQADGQADRLLAGRALVRHLGPGLDLTEQVDHGPGHPVVGRKVEGHDVGGVGQQADQRRRLADLDLGRRAQLAQQAVGDEPAHQVRHGHPGQAGGPGEVGPRSGAFREELLEDERTMMAAGIFG